MGPVHDLHGFGKIRGHQIPNPGGPVAYEHHFLGLVGAIGKTAGSKQLAKSLFGFPRAMKTHIPGSGFALGPAGSHLVPGYHFGLPPPGGFLVLFPQGKESPIDGGIDPVFGRPYPFLALSSRFSLPTSFVPRPLLLGHRLPPILRAPPDGIAAHLHLQQQTHPLPGLFEWQRRSAHSQHLLHVGRGLPRTQTPFRIQRNVAMDVGAHIHTPPVPHRPPHAQHLGPATSFPSHPPRGASGFLTHMAPLMHGFLFLFQHRRHLCICKIPKDSSFP